MSGEESLPYARVCLLILDDDSWELVLSIFWGTLGIELGSSGLSAEPHMSFEHSLKVYGSKLSQA